MTTDIEASIQAHFGNIDDPRRSYLNDHPLINIITIALCAVIAGAEGWTDIEMFGQQKQAWLSRFLDLKNGIPSHDTFGRVFARIDPEQFRQSFLAWVQAVFEVTDGQVIAVDGKQLRRSHDKSLGKRAMFLIPSIKVYNSKYSKTRQSVAKTVHNFLLETFGGYTCASGNIYGYFKSDTAEYDELREFRVAFLEDDQRTKVPLLQQFLATLCADIGEECIYLECGEDAMLVYP